MREAPSKRLVFSIAIVALIFVGAAISFCNKRSETSQRDSSDRCCTAASKGGETVAASSGSDSQSMSKESESYYQELFGKWRSQVTGDWELPEKVTLALRMKEDNRFYYFCFEEQLLGTDTSFVHYKSSVGIDKLGSIDFEYPIYAVRRPDNQYMMSNHISLYMKDIGTVEAVFIAADDVAALFDVDVLLCATSLDDFDMKTLLKHNLITARKLGELFRKVATGKYLGGNECLHSLISYLTWKLAGQLRLIIITGENIPIAPIQFIIALHAPNYSDLVLAINQLREDSRTFEAEMKPFEFVLSHAKDWDIYKDAWSIYECNHDLGQQGSR